MQHPTEGRTIVIGRGVTLRGVVNNAEMLVVEGTIVANLEATELAIAPGGICLGDIEVKDAEIAGRIDGTLITHGSLTIRATGRVFGKVRCRRLKVEDGAQITGEVEMLVE